MSDLDKKSRLEHARDACRELLQLLEEGQGPIDRALMKAQRLARMLRDSDAQVWLDKELRGYPEKFDLAAVGNCRKYWYRSYPDGSILTTSLPELEAQVKASDAILLQVRTPTITSPAENYVVAGATAQVLDRISREVNTRIEQYKAAVRLFNTIKASLHQYAADTFLALELGDYAEDIFEAALTEVDRFVRVHCPRAAEQLVAAGERMRDDSPEARSAALTACRRLLLSVADAVFPARDTPHEDRHGKARKVRAPEYKNRLLAFFETQIGAAGVEELLEAQLARIVDLVDVVYERSCKGVHADVTATEARVVVIQTYLLLAEVARLAPAGCSEKDATC